MSCWELQERGMNVNGIESHFLLEEGQKMVDGTPRVNNAFWKRRGSLDRCRDRLFGTAWTMMAEANKNDSNFWNRVNEVREYTPWLITMMIYYSVITKPTSVWTEWKWIRNVGGFCGWAKRFCRGFFCEHDDNESYWANWCSWSYGCEPTAVFGDASSCCCTNIVHFLLLVKMDCDWFIA